MLVKVNLQLSKRITYWPQQR
ncbi:hypothetical protein LEMLEM_LOCUS19864 [Lemmus lemmus]